MRGFVQRDIRAAIGHSLAGGQALHLHTLGTDKPGAPAVFRAAVARGEWIAHLFDSDPTRLLRTARALGVRVLVVDRPGEAAQHIDLCGGPLLRALALCENYAELPARPGANRPLVDTLDTDESAESAAPPSPPPRRPAAAPEEMRFGNMGSVSRPTYPDTGAESRETRED